MKQSYRKVSEQKVIHLFTFFVDKLNAKTDVQILFGFETDDWFEQKNVNYFSIKSKLMSCADNLFDFHRLNVKGQPIVPSSYH